MRVKLQLVMCSDNGQEETITNIVTLQKDGVNQTNGRKVSLTHGICDKNVTSTFFDVIWTPNLSLFLARYGPTITAVSLQHPDPVCLGQGATPWDLGCSRFPLEDQAG